MRRRRGLTLLEVLMALGLAGVVASSCLLVLGSVTRVRGATLERLAITGELEGLALALERELESALPRVGPGDEPFRVEDGGSPEEPRDILSFTSAGPEGSPVRRRYWIDQDGDTPGLMAATLGPVGDERIRRLSGGIIGLEVKVWTGSGWSDAGWNELRQGGLPVLVEVALIPPEQARTIRFRTALPAGGALHPWDQEGS